ncbi:MAG: hypothetical protein SH850_03800 [Planctomycetaceae bacterium]|nr:hypothetical protein [Planctomycetaceae bacterium]
MRATGNNSDIGRIVFADPSAGLCWKKGDVMTFTAPQCGWESVTS